MRGGDLAVAWPAGSAPLLAGTLAVLAVEGAQVHAFGTVRPGMQRASLFVGPSLLVVATIVCLVKT